MCFYLLLNIGIQAYVCVESNLIVNRQNIENKQDTNIPIEIIDTSGTLYNNDTNFETIYYKIIKILYFCY